METGKKRGILNRNWTFWSFVTGFWEFIFEWREKPLLKMEKNRREK
jgi:hypothetical protein